MPGAAQRAAVCRRAAPAAFLSRAGATNSVEIRKIQRILFNTAGFNLFS
jgi:hypothetical protein